MKTEWPQLDAKGLRRFGLTFAALVSVIFGIILPSLFDMTLAYWPWILGGTVATAALLRPTSLDLLYHGWMRFGHRLTIINTWLILFLLYYLMIVPTGLVMKLLGRDALARRTDSRAPTYRSSITKRDISHMEKPF